MSSSERRLNRRGLGVILPVGGSSSSEVFLDQQSVKQKVLEAVATLPTDATIEDVMERLYFLAKIQRGLDQAESGDTLTHEEAKERLLP
jgi:hypothetical protein